MLYHKCKHDSNSYITVAGRSSDVYPVVIAAHPKTPFQFALGLSDGSVHVLEPQEHLGKWPLIDNGIASSMDAPSPFASSSSYQTQPEPLD